MPSKTLATPEVCLTIQDENWIIDLKGELPLGSTYAFYLLRNGIRVAQRWYDASQSTQFPVDGIAGRYQARVFIKQPSSEDETDAPQAFVSAVVIQNGLPYDLRCWKHVPLFERNIAEPWIENPSDGLYHFTEKTLQVDLLLTGMEKLQKSPVVLVCFSGAISSRIGKSAPFFSGTGIAKRLDVPIISVADPTLSLSHELSLSWYLGNHEVHELPSRISKLLDVFAEVTGARLILFGGSGGGFASLLILSLLKSANASAFVCNPQITISNYPAPLVKRFLTIAFPCVPTSEDLRNWLDTTGVPHDLNYHDLLLTTKKSILYIQNKSDSHTESHARPFLENFKLRKKISAEVVKCSKNIAYWEGSWGVGHVVPPLHVIESALKQLLFTNDVSSVALALENEHASQQ